MLVVSSLLTTHTNNAQYSTLLPILMLYFTPNGLIKYSLKPCFLISGCYICRPVLTCGTFSLAFTIFMLKSCLIIKAYLKWHHVCHEKVPITPSPCDSAVL